MGKIIPIKLATQSAPARYKQGGSASLINCYVELIGDEGKVTQAIYASDGLQGFANLDSANGGVRAMLDVDGTFYVVAGTRFYSVTTSGFVTLIGSMNIDTAAPVYMDRNRRTSPDILICCNGLAYYYRAGVLAAVTDPNLIGPLSMVFHDGYFVIGSIDNRFQAGAIDDASTWPALSYGRADYNPDAVVRVARLQSDLLVFGTLSIQFYRDIGASPFPYAVVQSIDIGLLGAQTVATVNQTLAFVANDRTVRLIEGYNAQRISNHGVERDIQNISDASTIVATSWVRGGHYFYAISTSSWTWVYDTLTGYWHQRKSYGLNAWNITILATFGTKIIAGDRTTGTLYDMSPNYFDDAGVALVSEAVLPTVNAFPYRLTFNEVFFDIQNGVGLVNGSPQDIDPEMMFSLSRDGGATFGKQKFLKVGKAGRNITRVREQQLGQFGEDGVVFKVSFSSKTARAIYQAGADVDENLV